MRVVRLPLCLVALLYCNQSLATAPLVTYQTTGNDMVEGTLKLYANHRFTLRCRDSDNPDAVMEGVYVSQTNVFDLYFKKGCREGQCDSATPYMVSNSISGLHGHSLSIKGQPLNARMNIDGSFTLICGEKIDLDTVH